jgi:hypothetical protein
MKYLCKGANLPVRLSLSCQAARLAILAGAFGFAGVAWPHHSYAMFDMTKTVTFEGTVKEFQWTNPHAWIEVMVETPEGPKQYSLEASGAARCRPSRSRMAARCASIEWTLISAIPVRRRL